MKRQRSLFDYALPAIILVVGIGGFVALGGRTPPAKEDEGEAVLPLVEVVTAIPHDSGLDFDVDGVAAPYRELLLTAKVSGSIEFKAEECKAGRFVKKGALLMEIDPQDYRLEVARLTQELRQAEDSIKELDVEISNTKELVQLAGDELDLRKKELDRVVRLFSRNAGSDSEMDDAKRNELQSRNSQITLQSQSRLLTASRERLEHAQALAQTKLDKANLDLDRTRIVAPTDGVVVMDHVESGTYIQPGTTLVTFEDTSAVEVRCNLRMEELNWLWKQKNTADKIPDMNPVQRDYRFPTTDVTVFYELRGRRFTWQGKLSRYDGVGLDEKTRTVPCRVFVDHPRNVGLEGTDGLIADSPNISGPPALVRGMFVSVRIHARPEAKLLRLPERAVRPGNEVWLVRDGRLDRVQVHVARVTPAGAILDASRSDLSAGDQVVVTPMSASPKADGLGFVEEGMPVRVQTETQNNRGGD